MINTIEQANESVMYLIKAIKDIEDPKIKSYYMEQIINKAAIYGTNNHAEVIGLFEKLKFEYLNKICNQ